MTRLDIVKETNQDQAEAAISLFGGLTAESQLELKTGVEGVAKFEVKQRNEKIGTYEVPWEIQTLENYQLINVALPAVKMKIAGRGNIVLGSHYLVTKMLLENLRDPKNAHTQSRIMTYVDMSGLSKEEVSFHFTLPNKTSKSLIKDLGLKTFILENPSPAVRLVISLLAQPAKALYEFDPHYVANKKEGANKIKEINGE